MFIERKSSIFLTKSFWHHHKESLTKTIPDAVGYVTKKRLITQFCAHTEVHLSFGENIKIDQLYQK